jgi:DUF1680 family protein
VVRRWTDMVATRTYLTGGLGSRHRDEAFGDPFELPPDRAYAETCASIASVMLAWRLLLATGEPRFADVIERTMFNGVLAGLSLDGTHFFYVNPLQRRSHRSAVASATDGARASWYPCACCPPNLMRLFSSWEQYLATADDSGVQIHQYAAADIRVEIGDAAARLEVRTAYPWDGRVSIRIAETPADPWTLTLRIPPNARSVRITSPDGQVRGPAGDARSVDLRRAWRPDETVELAMELPPLSVTSDPRVDATRGCLAFERGPLVYCIETADIPAGVELEDVAVAADVSPTPTPRGDLGPSFVGLAVPASVRRAGAASGTDAVVGAIPYFAWANRRVEAMRVWIPTADAVSPDAPPAPADRSTDG